MYIFQWKQPSTIQVAHEIYFYNPLHETLIFISGQRRGPKFQDQVQESVHGGGGDPLQGGDPGLPAQVPGRGHGQCHVFFLQVNVKLKPKLTI